jgi:DNA-directed RNA polymerase specialized sigma24 family protein
MTERSLWTPEEFREWIEAKLSRPIDQKRWRLHASRLLLGLPVPPDDLVTEAVLRTLDGRRKFNREHSIEANFFEAMHSISSSWHKAHKRKPEISLEDLLGTDTDSTDPLEVFARPDGVQASPEDELIYQEELKAILAQFIDREDAQMVVLGRTEGFEGKALAEFAGIEHAKLASVLRLITRRLTAYRRDA